MSYSTEVSPMRMRLQHSSRDVEMVSYNEYRGVGPPSSTLGSVGDVYIDLTPSHLNMYGRYPSSWTPWRPSDFNDALAHPCHSGQVLWCCEDNNFIGWMSKKKLLSRKRNTFHTGSELLTTVLMKRSGIKFICPPAPVNQIKSSGIIIRIPPLKTQATENTAPEKVILQPVKRSQSPMHTSPPSKRPKRVHISTEKASCKHPDSPPTRTLPPSVRQIVKRYDKPVENRPDTIPQASPRVDASCQTEEHAEVETECSRLYAEISFLRQIIQSKGLEIPTFPTQTPPPQGPIQPLTPESPIGAASSASDSPLYPPALARKFGGTTKLYFPDRAKMAESVEVKREPSLDAIPALIEDRHLRLAFKPDKDDIVCVLCIRDRQLKTRIPSSTPLEQLKGHCELTHAESWEMILGMSVHKLDKVYFDMQK